MNDERTPEAQAAYERLRDQATGLDTMAARRSIEQRSRSHRRTTGALIAASVAAILAVVGTVALRSDDPDQDVATDPGTTAVTSTTPVTTSTTSTTVPIAPAETPRSRSSCGNRRSGTTP